MEGSSDVGSPLETGLLRRHLRHIAADPDRTHEYLLQVSMIASLRRAEELG